MPDLNLAFIAFKVVPFYFGSKQRFHHFRYFQRLFCLKCVKSTAAIISSAMSNISLWASVAFWNLKNIEGRIYESWVRKNTGCWLLKLLHFEGDIDEKDCSDERNNLCWHHTWLSFNDEYVFFATITKHYNKTLS